MRGRKPRPSSGEYTTIRVDAQTHSRLIKLAKAAGISLGDTVRRIVARVKRLDNDR